MTARNLPFAILCLLCFGANLYAQAPAIASPLPRYPGIKTQFNQSLSQARTNEQRLDLYRQTTAKGRYSGRPMLVNMFHNFDPKRFQLDPSTPGLPTTLRTLASDNNNVVKGNARTLRYAMSLQGDGRFKVVGLNLLRNNAIGKTDADIVFRHKSTGLQVRMEVKNMTISSQRSAFPRLQKQILKMAQDARDTGEMQVWANRQSVLPKVRVFAEQHGVRVEERLRTGSTNLLQRDRKFQDFANSLEKDLQFQAKLSASAGGLKAGMGIYLAYQAVLQLENDISNFGGTQGDWMRMGEHGSTLIAGGWFLLDGAAQVGRQLPEFANSARLVSLTKWGGRLGFAGAILAEGFLMYQHWSGNLTEQQFWKGQASLGGGLAGSAVGGWAGFWAGAGVGGAAGTIIPGFGNIAGAAVGGFLGAIGGGYWGGQGGSLLSELYFESDKPLPNNRKMGNGPGQLIVPDRRVQPYQLQDALQRERYAQFLLLYYQSP